ncbi:CD226 antigen [Ctenodactylus gundi]
MTLECVYPGTDTVTQVEWYKIKGKNKTAIAVFNPMYGLDMKKPYHDRVFFSNATLALNDLSLAFHNASSADVGTYWCYLHTFPSGSWKKEIQVVPSGAPRSCTDTQHPPKEEKDGCECRPADKHCAQGSPAGALCGLRGTRRRPSVISQRLLQLLAQPPWSLCTSSLPFPPLSPPCLFFSFVLPGLHTSAVLSGFLPLLRFFPFLRVGCSVEMKHFLVPSTQLRDYFETIESLKYSPMVVEPGNVTLTYKLQMEGPVQQVTWERIQPHQIDLLSSCNLSQGKSYQAKYHRQVLTHCSPGSKSSFIVIQNATASDSGLYRCRFKMSTGENETYVLELTVKEDAGGEEVAGTTSGRGSAGEGLTEWSPHGCAVDMVDMEDLASWKSSP